MNAYLILQSNLIMLQYTFVYHSIISKGVPAAWTMMSASRLHHQFLHLRLTACVSWLLPDHRASPALKQRMTPLESFPQRDTSLEAP